MEKEMNFDFSIGINPKEIAEKNCEFLLTLLKESGKKNCNIFSSSREAIDFFEENGVYEIVDFLQTYDLQLISNYRKAVSILTCQKSIEEKKQYIYFKVSPSYVYFYCNNNEVCKTESDFYTTLDLLCQLFNIETSIFQLDNYNFFFELSNDSISTYTKEVLQDVISQYKKDFKVLKSFAARNKNDISKEDFLKQYMDDYNNGKISEREIYTPCYVEFYKFSTFLINHIPKFIITSTNLFVERDNGTLDLKESILRSIWKQYALIVVVFYETHSDKTKFLNLFKNEINDIDDIFEKEQSGIELDLQKAEYINFHICMKRAFAKFIQLWLIEKTNHYLTRCNLNFNFDLWLESFQNSF